MPSAGSSGSQTEEQLLIETAIFYLAQSSAYRYTNVAFLALLLWDYFITLDQEVASIWALPWRLPKCLFLINRYLVPAMLFFNGLHPSIFNISPAVCDFVGKWTPWLTLLSITTIQLLLVIRVHVICNSKSTTIFIGLTFIASIISFIVLAIWITKGMTAGSGGADFPGCVFKGSGYTWAAWIPPVIFEMVIVSLTVWKLVQYRQTSMLYVVTRDSLVYFSVMFSSLLGNLLLNRFSEGYYSAILVLPSSVIACIAVARMTMNVRQFADPEEFSLDEFDVTTVDPFASRSFWAAWSQTRP